MRSIQSLATLSSAGIVLVMLIAAGATPSFFSIGRDIVSSYHSALRIYDKARMWGELARFWIDPEYVQSLSDARQDEDSALTYRSTRPLQF